MIPSCIFVRAVVVRIILSSGDHMVPRCLDVEMLSTGLSADDEVMRELLPRSKVHVHVRLRGGSDTGEMVGCCPGGASFS